MPRYTVDEIIDFGKVSIGLSANYQANGEIFGKRLATTAPNTIAIVTDALNWQWEDFPTTPEIDATATITIDTIGDLGDTIEVFVNDPFYGVISLGLYTITGGDTTTTITATNVSAELANNPYGYGSASSLNVITVTARAGLGATINGGNNIYVVITIPTFLIAENNDNLITENNNFLITE